MHVIILLFITGTSINAQFTLENAFPNLTFTSPVFLTHAGDNTDRIFVVEQPGRIKIFPNNINAPSSKEFLNITDNDSLGNEIDTIVIASQQKGFYQKTWSTEKFSSGVYFVKINTKSLSSDKIFSNVIKMLYLK